MMNVYNINHPYRPTTISCGVEFKCSWKVWLSLTNIKMSSTLSNTNDDLIYLIIRLMTIKTEIDTPSLSFRTLLPTHLFLFFLSLSAIIEWYSIFQCYLYLIHGASVYLIKCSIISNFNFMFVINFKCNRSNHSDTVLFRISSVLSLQFILQFN